MIDKEVHTMKSIEEAHWWFRAKDDFLLNRFGLELYQGNILDMGCGTGRFLRRLADMTQDRADQIGLFGLDASAVSVGYADTNRRINVHQGQAHQTGFESDRFDLVISSDVLEHLPDDVAGLREINRILRKGGMVLLTVPAYPWLFSSYDQALSHQRRYTQRTLANAVQSAQLEILQLGYFYGVLFPVFLAQRLLHRWRDRFYPQQQNAFTEMQIPPTFINESLFNICRLERCFLRLPFGSTVYCLARKY